MAGMERTLSIATVKTTMAFVEKSVFIAKARKGEKIIACKGAKRQMASISPTHALIPLNPKILSNLQRNHSDNPTINPGSMTFSSEIKPFVDCK